MPIPYRKRKQYYRDYYQKNKGVKSVKKGVEFNTNNLTPNKCQKCHELAEIKKQLGIFQTELVKLQTEKQPKTLRSIKEKKTSLPKSEQPVKVDIAQLERETGLTKD
jgi:hypothetical protein